MVDADNLDNRIIAFMRLVLAACGLLIIYIDPAEPNRLVGVTYTTLVLYTAYSALLYLLAHRCSPLLDRVTPWEHWADVGWYTLLISLSNGTSSIFFFGFFFAILVASFRWGFASGLRVTLAAAVLFGLIGLIMAPSGQAVELNRSLVRPVFLFVLGYLMAYWGGFELLLKRRLALLNEITSVSNPRFGMDRTLGTLLERLRAFYDADTCLLITSDEAGQQSLLRRATRRVPEAAVQAEHVPPALAAQLLCFPIDVAIIYNGRLPAWSFASRYEIVQAISGAPVTSDRALAAALAAMLDAASFVSVPFRDRNNVTGRLYVTGGKHRFSQSDADFLLQVIEHVAPVLDNIRLVDRLATSAAEEERQRIARDLHDSVIQPYIGLQIGLAAVQRTLADNPAQIGSDLQRLYDLTSEGIAELRGYVRDLRNPGERNSSLVPALRRFAERFAEATGIGVEVEAATDMRGNDRVAGEVFQMVAEGLSNIRRHTRAEHARIALQRANNHLLLRIENDPAPDAAIKSFTPRSISERAAALGGRAHVEQQPNAGTVIVVEIPL